MWHFNRESGDRRKYHLRRVIKSASAITRCRRVVLTWAIATTTKKKAKHMVSCHATHCITEKYVQVATVICTVGCTFGSFQALLWPFDAMKWKQLEHALYNPYEKPYNQDYCYLFWFVSRLECVVCAARAFRCPRTISQMNLLLPFVQFNYQWAPSPT